LEVQKINTKKNTREHIIHSFDKNLGYLPILCQVMFYVKKKNSEKIKVPTHKEWLYYNINVLRGMWGKSVNKYILKQVYNMPGGEYKLTNQPNRVLR
jgi:hypothetical protein